MASQRTRTQRLEAFLSKQSKDFKTPLPHDWIEQEVTLERLVDLRLLTAEEAAAKAAEFSPAAAGPPDAGDIGANDSPPDLSHKLPLYTQFSMAPGTVTEDWRRVGGFGSTSVHFVQSERGARRAFIGQK